MFWIYILRYMERVGLGAWKEAFETSLPQKCVSIAAVRTTTRQDLGRLPFKLEAAHIMQVMKALRKDPLETEIAGSRGGMDGLAAPAPAPATRLSETALQKARREREEKRKALAGSRSSPSSAPRLSRPYKAEVGVGLWVAVVGKTQPAKLLVDNCNESWKVEYSNKGGEATVQERSMKPCTGMQKRTMEKIRADDAAGTGSSGSAASRTTGSVSGSQTSPMITSASHTETTLQKARSEREKKRRIVEEIKRRDRELSMCGYYCRSFSLEPPLALRYAETHTPMESTAHTGTDESMMSFYVHGRVGDEPAVHRQYDWTLAGVRRVQRLKAAEVKDQREEAYRRKLAAAGWEMCIDEQTDTP